MSETFQCPGESQPISRSVHLGRLANFYPACRTCPRRDETGALSQKQVAHLASVRRRAPHDELFDAEGISGVADVDIDSGVARRFAMAFGEVLPDSQPTVILAGDARPITAELVAAAAEGLRRASCHVIDIGGATSAVLSTAIAGLGAAGGLLVGNAEARPLTASLKAFGAAGRPWSLGGSLSAVREQMTRSAGRASRRSGTIRRVSVEAEYLASLRDDFHAFRPLRVSLDSASLPLRSYLHALCDRVAVEFVTHDKFDLGLVVDGDGEVCRVTDERGHTVDGDDLLALFVRNVAHVTRHVSEEEPERSASLAYASGYLSSSTCLRENSSREATFDLMSESAAELSGGPSGRFWFVGATPTCDALRAISTLLSILSQSDRPLSQRVAGDIVA